MRMPKKKKKLISVDFDGTIVTHEYPDIGEFLPHAQRVLKRIQDAEHRLILNTCREDSGKRKYLTEAVEFCMSNGINFVSVNENHQDDDFRDGKGRKVYANLHIDDKNFHPENMEVDWLVIEAWMEKEGWLEKVENSN